MEGTPPRTARSPFSLAFSLGSIPVIVEPSFWLVGLFAASYGGGWERALVWTSVIFVSVLTHELGHAVAARAFGSPVRVHLYALGGLTFHRTLSRGRGILVSLAGPFAGFVFGGLIFLASRAVALPHPLAQEALRQLFFVNFLWGAVNLMPVLPLDGGHVLAGLAGEKRTKLVAGVSLVTAGLLAFVGWTYGFQFAAIMFGFLGFRSAMVFFAKEQPATPADQGERPHLGPRTPQTVLADGWKDLFASDDQQAERAGREVLTTTDAPLDRAKALDLLAWVELTRADFAGALHQLQRIQPPELSRALTWGLAYEGVEQPEKALPYALRAAEEEPSETSAQLAIRLLTRAGRYDEAAARAESFLWGRPGRKESALGNVELARGSWRMAKDLLGVAFRLGDRPADAYNAACAAARGNETQEALQWLTEAVRAGYDDRESLKSDPDLERVRLLPGFGDLLAKL